MRLISPSAASSCRISIWTNRQFLHFVAYIQILIVFLPLLVVFSFVCGLYAYIIGAHFQAGTGLDFNSLLSVLTQDGFTSARRKLWRITVPFTRPGVAELSIVELLLLRLIFVDTFLIPSLLFGSSSQVLNYGFVP